MLGTQAAYCGWGHLLLPALEVHSTAAEGTLRTLQRSASPEPFSLSSCLAQAHTHVAMIVLLSAASCLLLLSEQL